MEAREALFAREEVERELRRKANAVTILMERADLPLLHLQNSEGGLHNQKWLVQNARLRRKLGHNILYALLGPRGTGKTQMGVCLLRDVCLAERSALYTLAMDLFIRIKECYNNDGTSGPKERDVLLRYISPSLLVIDEVQVRSDTQWETDKLSHIVDKRYFSGKDTILISNKQPTDFFESIGSSITNRMQECGAPVICDWASFRLPKGDSSQA